MSTVFLGDSYYLITREELGVTEEELRTAALNDEKIREFIEGREVVKVIVVPKRLVNVVVR